ncbi:MAG: hypothetical protein WDM92_01940 [Caulobacteraceae bacterium]
MNRTVIAASMAAAVAVGGLPVTASAQTSLSITPGAVRLLRVRRPSLLLVRRRLARARLVLVRLSLAARLRLGRPLWLA